MSGNVSMRKISISPGGSLCNLDGDGPVGVLVPLAPRRFEVQLLQAARDRAHRSRAYLAVVYLRHRRYLETGAGKKDLVGGVELGAAHVTLVGRHPSSFSASSITASRVIPSRMSAV